ncbi:hypothetical protein L1049_027428 [Liquidambar formosana]|uniref:Uncharacterized protein n=1 Tax=Liquidambar formosana TaxID=63359 RepID=A0AAP0WUZ7_LIQFO
MLPSSNSNGNNSSSISYYTDQATIFHRPFLTDIISPNSKQEDHPLPIFHFPSPFMHYEVDDDVFLHRHHDLLLQQQQQQQQQPPLMMTDNSVVAETLANVFDSNKNIDIELMGDGKRKNNYRVTTEQTPRRRSSKRDRHSKINTAQGPRDRRMRLSLEIARRFFDLQDMLGFDKASKTVEWLLSKSKNAIKELARGLPQMKAGESYSVGTKSASSTSECEVVSGIDEIAVHGNQHQQGKISKDNKPSTYAMETKTGKEKKIRQSRKAAFHVLARESREKARARARERTKEKMWSRCLIHESKPFNEAIERNGEESTNMNDIPPLEVPVEVEGRPSHEGEHLGITAEDMVDDSLVSMGKWSPSFYHYIQNAGIFQEHQFADFQF